MPNRFEPRLHARLSVWMVLACWASPILAADRAPPAAGSVVALADFDQTAPQMRSSTGVTVAVAEPPRPVKPDERNAPPQREASDDGPTTADAAGGPGGLQPAEPLLPTGKACRISSGGPGGAALSSERWPTDWRSSAMLCLWVFRQPTDERPETIELRWKKTVGRTSGGRSNCGTRAGS